MRVLLLVVLAACGGGPGGEPPVAPQADPHDAAVEDEFALSDEAYRFCHVPGADADDALTWCPLLDEIPPERCPGLRATCDEGTRETILDAESLGRGCQPPATGDPTASPAPPPERPDDPMSCRRGIDPPGCTAPSTSGGFLLMVMQWVTAIAVALLLLVVVRLILRFVASRRDSGGDVVVEELAAVVLETAPDEVPDLPSADLLDAAKRAFDQGRWGDAILLARHAALRRLGDAGRLRLHRSRTDREYLRAVRRDADLHDPLSEVLRAAEQHKWGGVPAERTLAERVLAAATRLLGVAACLVLVVGLMGAGGDRFRYGPVGDAALFGVFADAGFEVSWRLRGLATIDDTVDVLVLDLTGIVPSDADWEAVREWVAAGGVLLVGGDPFDGFPEAGHTTLLPGDAAVTFTPTLHTWLPLPVFPGGPLFGWDAPGGTPWVVSGSGAPDDANRRSGSTLAGGTVAVVQSIRVGEGVVIAIADARLLYNGALIVDDNADFVGGAASFGAMVSGVALAEPARLQLATLSSAGSDSPIGALANARLLPLVLQLLLLIAVGALWKGWPFAPLRDPPDEGRLRFSEHVTALGMRWSRLGASHHALREYAELWMNRVGPHRLVAAAEKAGRTPSEAARLVERLRAVLDDEERGDDPSDLRLLEELWSITSRR